MNAEIAREQQTLEDQRTPEDQQAPNNEALKDQGALLAELGTSQESVDALVGELRSLDAQLEALAGERNQHRLLHQVCDALGELGKLGGAQLFWGTAQAAKSGEEQLGRVRERVAAFESRVGELEARRQSTREQIDQEQYRVGLIEDGLFDAQEQEERLRQEWIVEREISGLHSRALAMPWTWGGEDDRRFQKALLSTLAVCLLLALIIPLIRLPLLQAPEETPPEQVLHITMAQLPRQPAGLMVFKQQLAALAQAQINPALGAQASINNANSSVGRPERAMLTTSAPGSSGGINLAAVSRGL